MPPRNLLNHSSSSVRSCGQAEPRTFRTSRMTGKPDVIGAHCRFLFAFDARFVPPFSSSLRDRTGASLAYVKDQMGHSSIQVTVGIYGHLLPGANVSYVDGLDSETNARESATPAQPEPSEEPESTEALPLEIVEIMGEDVGGGGWTRTNDLRIMRPSL